MLLGLSLPVHRDNRQNTQKRQMQLQRWCKKIKNALKGTKHEEKKCYCFYRANERKKVKLSLFWMLLSLMGDESSCRNTAVMIYLISSCHVFRPSDVCVCVGVGRNQEQNNIALNLIKTHKNPKKQFTHNSFWKELLAISWGWKPRKLSVWKKWRWHSKNCCSHRLSSLPSAVSASTAFNKTKKAKRHFRSIGK